jgi:hypothetical protein
MSGFVESDPTARQTLTSITVNFCAAVGLSPFMFPCILANALLTTNFMTVQSLSNLLWIWFKHHSVDLVQHPLANFVQASSCVFGSSILFWIWLKHPFVYLVQASSFEFGSSILLWICFRHLVLNSVQASSCEFGYLASPEYNHAVSILTAQFALQLQFPNQ